MDITNFAIALIALGFAAIGLAIPYLVKKYGQDNISKALSVIGILVKAAEQMFQGQNQGKDKLHYVEKEFAKYGIKIDTSLVRAMIESEVYKLKMGA